MLAAALLAMGLGAALHVRANAPLGGDGSEERPFAKISEALAHAPHGGTVSLAPGLYEEALVLDRPVTLTGSSAKTVIAAPPGSAVSVDVRAPAHLLDLDVQGGRVGVHATAAVQLRDVRLRGQPDAAVDCEAGARCELSQVRIESSFAQASGVRGGGEVLIDGVEISGPFRRALDVSGSLTGRELFVHGAVTGLQAAGAKVTLRAARFEDLRGTCIFGARGTLALTGLEVSGCEAGIEVREGEQVELRDAEIARCIRVAISSTEAKIVGRDLLVQGPSRDGAVMISGGSLSLVDTRFHNPGPTGIAARLAKVHLQGLTVEGARMDRDGDFGDGLFLYDSELSGQGLLARSCEGAAIEAQLGKGRIAELEVERAGQAALVLEHGATLDVDGLLATGGQGAGLACIEHSSAHLRASSLRGLAGGSYLVDCSCKVSVQPTDPALGACGQPP